MDDTERDGLLREIAALLKQNDRLDVIRSTAQRLWLELRDLLADDHAPRRRCALRLHVNVPMLPIVARAGHLLRLEVDTKEAPPRLRGYVLEAGKVPKLWFEWPLGFPGHPDLLRFDIEPVPDD